MDPSNQIKFIDNKNQLADILIKGSFTRDEWNHLLFLFSIMNLSMFSCTHFFLSSRKQTVHSAVSNRTQEESSEENVSSTTKPKSRSVILVIVKPRSISLMSREGRMSSYVSSRERSDSESPRNVKVGKDSVRIGIWKHMTNTSPYPAEQSQMWRPQSIQKTNRKE